MKRSPCSSALCLLAVASIHVVAEGACTFDPARRVMSNESVSVVLPGPGSKGSVAVHYRGKPAALRHWYYIVMGSMQTTKRSLRCLGPVVKVEPLVVAPDRVQVRVTRLTDHADEPDVGTFQLTYELRQGQSTVRHSMRFTPKGPLLVQGYEFFVATAQPKAETHRFHFIEPQWRLGSVPAKTRNRYGRIAFPRIHPWLGLEDTTTGEIISVGVPPADVSRLQYAIDFKRFEFGRSAGLVTPSEPLEDFAWISFGSDPTALAQMQRLLEQEVRRPSRTAEPALPKPVLDRRTPEGRYGQGIDAARGAYHVRAGGLRLTVDGTSGVLSQLEAGGGRLLDAPGGVCFVRWPDRRRIGPQMRTSHWSAGPKALTWQWQTEGLAGKHAVETRGQYVAWTAEAKNTTGSEQLLEVCLALPLALGPRPWRYWDGYRLRPSGPNAGRAEMTTLMPGGRGSQGIFPAACLHSDAAGVAVGMEPMHIESFYGSRVAPRAEPIERFHYALRWALPAGETRTARFVIYPIDPQWSWRSCVERYWGFWPEVFAAPDREDLWGLYSTASPAFVHRQGDKFIEMCRRLRIGGMELYGPFNKTGDFYPDREPAYKRAKNELSRDDVRHVFEIANIASCNLSYVIPTKCERAMALATYSDSIIRLPDGSPFLRDYWDVMGGGREKLAGMFAWGNRFGRSLRGEIQQIVTEYRPEGFYFDNGAFVWQDYGRRTPWTAFDDEGRVYTNAGIAYAMVQDDLRDFAPHVHRNPGEFIQYFSGFRGQSHLTNVTGTQKHYVRSHRLIMGYKPIYTAHPDRIGSKEDLLALLEVGGLPWLTGMRRTLEPLAQAWAPVAVALARAGWRPVPYAAADSDAVRVERFGSGEGTLFTVRNLGEAPAATVVTFVGRYPRLCDFFGRQKLRPQVDSQGGFTRVSLTVPSQDMVFLRAQPAPPAVALPAPARFLADALPTSIVTRPDAAPVERHAARWVRGFLQMQAYLLKKPEAVEIVDREATAQHAHRVLIQPAEGRPTLSLPSAARLVIAVGREAETRQRVSDYLDTLAKPFSTEPARWTP